MSDSGNSSPIIASVDLGSNSFHMVVARIDDDGNLIMIDKLKEMVRLRGGLDHDRRLIPSAEKAALACLQRFGDRIRHLPRDSVRVAGTNTLRTMVNSEEFLLSGKEALGHPIEIISGQEEARLIYLGVAHTLSDDGGSQLVVDIGGGSTEFILGQRFKPTRLESINVGSVSMTQRYFPGGILEEPFWKVAHTAIQLELTPLQKHYHRSNWSMAIGASGTIKAARSIMLALGLSKFGLDLQALHSIRDLMIEAGHIDNLDLPGLKPDRAPVFAGGLAILIAIFEVLKIRGMTVSEGALREGLLYDLVGRHQHEDVREKTVKKMLSRFKVDVAQGEQVKETALHLFDRVKKDWRLKGVQKTLLAWASQLHEVGMAIDHSRYHEHGAYILRYAYMPGFSRRDQLWLSVLTRTHRKKINTEHFDVLTLKERDRAIKVCTLLRLSILLHRSRRDEQLLPEIDVSDNEVRFTCENIKERPMLVADLEREKAILKSIDIHLSY